MSNPFGLIYGGAIEANEPGKVNIRPVRYAVDGIEAAANLYLPADYSEKNKKKYPAVTVAHPNGGCKEQVAGLYAQRLAELGFITLACDARYQGESGGEPRLRDYPANRAQTDKRIKAVATLSMFNSGRVRRNGFHDADKEGAQKRLRQAAAARAKELRGEVEYIGFLPPDKTDEELRAQMLTLPENTLYRDGIEYYGLTHRHPNATGSYTAESFMKLIAFDVEDRMDLIDQPLLMICGEKADTLYMSVDAFIKAVNADDKELYTIPNASHIRTYWVEEYVCAAVNKLDAFFHKYL